MKTNKFLNSALCWHWLSDICLYYYYCKYYYFALGRYIPGGFKIYEKPQKCVQIVSLCSQGLASCREVKQALKCCIDTSPLLNNAKSYCVIDIFLTLGLESRGSLKIEKKYIMGYNHQSVQSVALKRCTKIEILWYRKLVSRASPVFSEILLPSSVIIIIILAPSIPEGKLLKTKQAFTLWWKAWLSNVLHQVLILVVTKVNR